jgi:OOP family OmpA-OmpF porin
MFADDCIMVKELNVQFENDSTVYMDEQAEMQEMQEFADFIKQTDLYVLIEGHTNTISTIAYNEDLSAGRAHKVKEELINLGVNENHIDSAGFGELLPLYDNNTDEGLEKNRRVIAEVFNSKEELDLYKEAQLEKMKAAKN